MIGGGYFFLGGRIIENIRRWDGLSDGGYRCDVVEPVQQLNCLEVVGMD